MHLPKFEYFEPKTIEEACSLLSESGTKLIAGGTELLMTITQRLATPRALINIKVIPNLNYVDYNENEGLNIGTLTPLHTIAASSVVRDRFSALAQAAGSVGTPQIRNVATLGGNVSLDSRCFYYNQSRLWRQSRPACFKAGGDVCHVIKTSDHCQALFVADTVPALIAMGAKVNIARNGSQEQIALEKFYSGRGEKPNLLQAGQVVTQVWVPKPPPHTGIAYLKYSLRGLVDFAVLTVAAMIGMETEDGICNAANIILGSVSTKPARAIEAEGIIKGREANDSLIDEIGQVASREIHPVTHMGIPASYKRKIIRTVVRRAVRQALQLAKSA